LSSARLPRCNCSPANHSIWTVESL